jgi:hypothetical protein
MGRPDLPSRRGRQTRSWLMELRVVKAGTRRIFGDGKDGRSDALGTGFSVLVVVRYRVVVVVVGTKEPVSTSKRDICDCPLCGRRVHTRPASRPGCERLNCELQKVQGSSRRHFSQEKGIIQYEIPSAGLGEDLSACLVIVSKLAIDGRLRDLPRCPSRVRGRSAALFLRLSLPLLAVEPYAANRIALLAS